MNLPDIPSPFRQPSPAERPWHWQFVNDAGDELSDDSIASDFTGQRFASQGDAESWIGEIWHDLLDQGVEAVVLFEHDRRVYGPMSLRAG